MLQGIQIKKITVDKKPVKVERYIFEEPIEQKEN